MIERLNQPTPVAGWVAQAVAPSAVPARTVEAKTDAAQVGSDQRRPPDHGLASGQIVPLPNPDRPTGPPPSFEANVLDAERERQRRGAMSEIARGEPDPLHEGAPVLATLATRQPSRVAAGEDLRDTGQNIIAAAQPRTAAHDASGRYEDSLGVLSGHSGGLDDPPKLDHAV